MVGYSGKTVSKGNKFLMETAGSLLYHKSDVYYDHQLLQNLHFNTRHEMIEVEKLENLANSVTVY